MGLFTRKIKQGSNLTGMPTDRLLREYAETAGGTAFVAEQNAKAEFATPENPVVMNAEHFAWAINAMVIHQEIGAELERRGLKPQ
ncbi:hypothetical protein OG474_06535 [Kribbella sp. NBC_01505]|uniref:hypothetical protein n=1 Tax=Kribbella sp. NBC_01505 TaxID=2903580 RepID=UPI00386C0307